MANPLKQLRGLIPQDVVQVGTSQGPNGDGTTNVSLLGGGTVVCSGTGYSNGTPVFIKGSVILSAAPSPTAVDIEV
jgi:hypothetical protein